MVDKIVYPTYGGVKITLTRSGTIVAGDHLKITADSTVARTGSAANIQAIALDAGVEGIDADQISVLILAKALIVDADIGSTAVGYYLKPDTDGTWVSDGATKTANSLAFVVDATLKLIAII